MTESKDSRYSWCVCAVTFISNFMSIGFNFSIGVYFVTFLDIFNETSGTTAWISSLNLGILCSSGPLASTLIKHYGLRVAMFCGGCTAAFGIVVSSFATNIYTIIISFGIVTGFGSGIAYTTGIVAIENYFDKHRAIAFGIGSLGTAVANMSFPWIITSLITYYGWRGALMLSSGLVAQICVAAMILRPAEQNSGNGPHSDEPVKISTSFVNQTKRIFQNGSFVLHCVSSVLLTLTVSVVLTHVAAYAESEGLQSHWSNALITTIGASNIAGRLSLSSLIQHPRMNAIVVHAAAVFCVGISVVIWGIWTSLIGMIMCAATFGFFMASISPTWSESIVLLTGSELSSLAFGFSLGLSGFGGIIGAPLAGWTYDLTSYYPASFFLGGLASMLGAAVLIPVIKQNVMPSNT